MVLTAMIEGIHLPPHDKDRAVALTGQIEADRVLFEQFCQRTGLFPHVCNDLSSLLGTGESQAITLPTADCALLHRCFEPGSVQAEVNRASSSARNQVTPYVRVA
jgi:hypothetical protein